MTKLQFLLTTLLAVLLGALITTNIFLARTNATLGSKVYQGQVALNNGRQAENILRQLTLRIAQGSESDADLRKLMIRNELRASLTVDGKKKEYPQPVDEPAATPRPGTTR